MRLFLLKFVTAMGNYSHPSVLSLSSVVKTLGTWIIIEIIKQKFHRKVYIYKNQIEIWKQGIERERERDPYIVPIFLKKTWEKDPVLGVLPQSGISYKKKINQIWMYSDAKLEFSLHIQSILTQFLRSISHKNKFSKITKLDQIKKIPPSNIKPGQAG